MNSNSENPASFHTLHVKKEALKFSSAHMTLFQDGTKEAIHGHNYFPEIHIRVRRIDGKDFIPFSEVKSAMKAVSSEWDEKVLLPARAPQFKITKENEIEIEFLMCGKRYVLPRDEVVKLDLDNVTTETLSVSYFQAWKAKMPPSFFGPNLIQVEVRIDEIQGQGASYTFLNA